MQRCLFGALCFASASAGNLRSPPALIPQWRANAHLTQGTYIFKNISGVFLSDSTNKRFRLTITTHANAFSPREEQVNDFLLKDIRGDYLNITIGTGRDAVCHPFAVPGKSFEDTHGDPFWWLPHATFSAMTSIEGRQCSCFRFIWQGMDATMCFDQDGLPRFLGHNAQASVLSWASSTFGSFLVFSNVTVGALDDAAFAPSSACQVHFPLPPCVQTKNDHGGVVKLDVYRLQGPLEPLELANRNAGDAAGDTFYSCYSGASGGAGRLMVHYVVMANSSWGQFNHCQYGARNFCTGSPGPQVGRSTPEALGGRERGGQCTDNRDLGSWYSFPDEGECRAGEDVGSRGCTWSARLARIVDARCVLVHRGLLSACGKEEGHPPFRNATAIFVKALASENPSHGGCPSVAEILV